MTGTLILLAVLRTIGRILLWILAAVLILILLLLFVPVRYRAEGCIRDREGGETPDPGRVKEALQGEVRVSWLLHLVRLTASWKGESSVSLRILFFRVPLGKQEKAGKPEETEEKKPEPKEKKAGSDIGKIRSLLGSSETKAAIRAILERSGRLIRSILPKKWTLEGSAGLGGPDGTGMLMEAEGILFPVLCGHVWITPEFEKYSADLAFSAKGSIRLIRLAVTIAVLLADRNVRELIRAGKDLAGPQEETKRHES